MHRLILLLAVTVLLGACADDAATPPTAPESTADEVRTWMVDPATDEALLRDQPPGSAYPLQLGNVWKYRARVNVHTVPDEGEPVDEEIIRTTKSEIIGASTGFGRCYTIEELTIQEDAGDGEVTTQRVLYRQDRAGLYEVASLANGPQQGDAGMAARFAPSFDGLERPEAWNRALRTLQQRLAPVYAMKEGRGGVLDGELTRLVYPLRPGQHWVVRNEPFVMTSTVVRHVVLDLAIGRTAAWKVRVESELFGPEDVVHMYYGRDGYLGWELDLVVDATDESGTPIGTMLFTDREYLESLSIDRRGELPCAGSEPAPSKGVPGLNAG